MEEKKFTWDARDAVALVLAAMTIAIALLYPTVAPVATIFNGLAAALVLRPRTRADVRDLIGCGNGGRRPHRGVGRAAFDSTGDNHRQRIGHRTGYAAPRIVLQ